MEWIIIESHRFYDFLVLLTKRMGLILFISCIFLSVLPLTGYGLIYLIHINITIRFCMSFPGFCKFDFEGVPKGCVIICDIRLSKGNNDNFHD